MATATLTGYLPERMRHAHGRMRSIVGLLSLLLVSASSGQSIIAGMVGVGDHYVDVAPDTLLSELNVSPFGLPTGAIPDRSGQRRGV
jgi:hypothetical protein